MAIDTLRLQKLLTLEERVEKENKLNVLITSNYPAYNDAALEVFSTKISTALVIPKDRISRLIERGKTKNLLARVGVEPDIILYNIVCEQSELRQQLALMKEIGLRFPYAALIGTLDEGTHRMLFGSTNQINYAYSSMWNQIREARILDTIPFRIAYPDVRDSDDARRIFFEGLTQLRNDPTYLGITLNCYRLRSDKNTCKLFCTDYDGTLLSDDGSVSNENIGAIKKVSQLIPVVFASGRAPASMEEIARLIEPSSDWYLIAHNGALVLNSKGKTLYEKKINPEDAVSLIEKVEVLRTKDLHKGNLLVNYFLEDTLLSVKDESVEDLRDEYASRNMGRLQYILLPMGDLKELPPPNKILIIVRKEKHSALRDFQEAIDETLESRKELAVRLSQPNYFEFTSSDVTKGTALKKLIEKLGIYPRNVAYIGNGFNDIDALRLVGYPFIVENAPKGLFRKLDNEASRRIINVPSNNHDGVAHAIKRLEGMGAYKPLY